MPTTPEEWLPILARRLDERATHIKLMRSYCDGHAPLPEMGRNLRASWEAFQKKARVNYGGLAVRALKNRIRPRDVRIGETDSPALVAAKRIWRDNRLHRQFGEAINDRLEVRVGYIAVGRGPDGKAVVTREKPEQFFALTDALQPWRASQAIKVWRDDVTDRDYAWVWVSGRRQRFVRTTKKDGITRTRAVEGWEVDGEPETYDGNPPVVVLSRPDGKALVEPHYDVIDGLNLSKLQRLVIAAMQAFRQRALKSTKDGGGLPEKDEDGNDLDYSKIFEPAPGALWELPEGIDIWESQSTDLQGLLESEKADARTFAAVTSTPISVFIPDGQNQSAEGASNAKENHVSLAEDEIADLGPGLAMAIVYGLRIENVDLGDQTVEIDFAPPALISLTEKYDAASKATGILARRTIQRTILGMTDAEMDEDEQNRAEEQLAAFALAGGQPDTGGNAA